MKLKRIRIAVELLSQTHARWKKALKGEAVSKRAVITVASWRAQRSLRGAAQSGGVEGKPVIPPSEVKFYPAIESLQWRGQYPVTAV